MEKILFGYLVACLLIFIDPVKSTCVFESDFGFTLNCAFKKSGLFRVRNLGGFKAHVGLGFSVGDELGFGQSLTNLDTSRRRSVNVKNGSPNTIGVLNEQPQRQEKRGKQNRLTVRMPSPSPSAAIQAAPTTANMAAMQAILGNAMKRRGSPAAPHMQPIVVQGDSSENLQTGRGRPTQITVAKPFPLGVPPFKPLPPKDQSDVRVLPIANPTKQVFMPYPVADSKGPALAYTRPNTQATHEHVSKLLAQMQNQQQQLTQRQDHLVKITPAPIRVNNIGQNLMTTHNNHVNLPAFQAMPSSISKITESPMSYGLSVVPGPVFKNTVQIPTAPSMMSKGPTIASLTANTVSLRKSQPAAPSPTAPSYSGQKYPQDAEMATNVYPIYAQSPVQKIDDVNSITGYGDEDEFKYSPEDEVAQKISAISKATNISVEAVEAAILLRQQQLLNRYAAIAPSAGSTTTSTTTSTTSRPTLAPEIIVEPVTPKRYVVANTAKVMNAPREYYPIGYEKNFDDQFTSKVELPETSFYCGDQKYFPGLYADENLGCMVFHVCALTDDGLVMKSFLCPESTLFDQTILKCNWWFYVDCKSSKSLYDTNIPISKSYQLMKALTFFSNYKKEAQQAEQAPVPDPENMDGIKEAIAILENHKAQTQNAPTGINKPKPSVIHIITPPRNGSIQNHRLDREFKERPIRNSSGEESAVHTAVNQAAIDTLKVTPKSTEDTVDTNKVDRRRRLGQFTRRTKNNTINKNSTLDSTTSVLAESVLTTSVPEIQSITPAEEVKESSTHHRIARASGEDVPDLVAAESYTESLYVASPDKSIIGEKPRIEKEETIAKLDEAIIGKPETENRKKVNKVEIITPQSASS